MGTDGTGIFHHALGDITTCDSLPSFAAVPMQDPDDSEASSTDWVDDPCQEHPEEHEDNAYPSFRRAFCSPLQPGIVEVFDPEENVFRQMTETEAMRRFPDQFPPVARSVAASSSQDEFSE